MSTLETLFTSSGQSNNQPRMSHIIDLSHVIEPGMITYPGLPAPKIRDHLSRESSKTHYTAGTTFQIGAIEMVANTGTYVDTPFHRYENGYDLSELPLAQVADVEGVVIDTTQSKTRALGSEWFEEMSLENRAVLVRTDWSKHWRTDQYGRGHPFLTREAAVRLVEAKCALVGIDSINIDDTGDGTRPAHSLLLEAGIPIAEHLCNLASLPRNGFRMHCVPVKFKGVGTFPVRAYAVVR